MPFRDVIGHRRLIDLLSRSVERGTLPPSMIFAGPSGVGKRLAAMAVAQALNCLDRRRAANEHNLDACGVCTACSKIARGVHPDVLVVEPGESGSIKIDQVREVVDRAGYRPFEGRRRVVLIDEADALVPHAQNALLKTLEEPPPSSVFILVTSRPDMLLPTVRSRCPRLQFRPLPAADIAAALTARGRSEAEARAVAATADGSLGRALATSGDAIVEAREVAHRVLVHAARTSDAARRLDAAKELASGTRDDLSAHLHAMASLLRDAEVIAAGADDSVLANSDVRGGIEQIAPAFRGDRGVAAFSAIDQAIAALDRNAGVKVVADWLVLQL